MSLCKNIKDFIFLIHRLDNNLFFVKLESSEKESNKVQSKLNIILFLQIYFLTFLSSKIFHQTYKNFFTEIFIQQQIYLNLSQKKQSF